MNVGKISIPYLFIALSQILCAQAVTVEFGGFTEARLGVRTQEDPAQDQMTLGELRLQLDAALRFNTSTIKGTIDVIYDDLEDDRTTIDLDQGTGFIDLRELYYRNTALNSADLTVGRQILSWGTGDLLFINDLFPKDWNAFYLGREEGYLYAPSDALYASCFPALGMFEIAYMPTFDPDRHIDPNRLSSSRNTETDTPDERFKDHELSIRLSRPFMSWESALYAYHGFWKSPKGYDIADDRTFFPRLNAYGASAQGYAGEGAEANLEIGYYDAREESSATQTVPHDELRFLMGYGRQLQKNLAAGIQYYLEWMQDYDDYKGTRDEFRHVLTLRLTQHLMKEKLMIGLFTFYSPSDNDAYFRLNALYKLTDHWQATAFGNFFIGEEDYTYFGQLQNNSNVGLSIRYSF